jgi:UDP-galactopyranose mutase
LDSFFDYGLGRLPYRTLDFIHERHPKDYQGVAIMNYGDETIPFTRITEHKHLAPWESHEDTIISREFSRECGIKDTPYYPVRLARDQPLLQQYRNMALNTDKLSFVGRLGTYCYLDMDACIRRAMDAATVTLDCMGKMRPIPPFFEQD